MNSFFIALFFVNSAFGWVSPYFSNEQKRMAFTFVNGNYEDTRIDVNQDKELDFWRIKKGNLTIEITSSGDEKNYRVRKFLKDAVLEQQILQKGSKLFLLSSRKRPLIYFNFTTTGPVCSENSTEPWKKFLSDYESISKVQVLSKVENYLSDECFESENSGLISSAIYDVLVPPVKIKKNLYLDCLEGDDAKAMFTAALGEKEGLVQHQKAIIGFKNAIISISAGTTKDTKILCKSVEKDSKLPPMQTSEDGQIQINITKGEKLSSGDLKEKIFHEVLHRSSIENEVLTEQLTKLCKKGDLRQELAQSKNFSRSLFLDKTTLSDASEKAKDSTPQVIPKEVAEAPAQLPKSGSPTDMNRVADAGGAQAVKDISEQQTSGVIRMAERVLVGSPAVAADLPTTGLASSDSGGGGGDSSAPSYTASSYSSDPSPTKTERASSSRSPASEYKLSTKVVTDSEVAAAKNLKNMGSSGLRTGEYIKEEVDLTRGTSYTAPAASQEVTGARSQTAQRNIASTTNSEMGSAPQSASAAAVGSAAPSSNAGNYSGGGSLGNSSIPTRQAAQKTGQRGTASAYVPSQDEVVSFFSSGSYNQARSKLKDQNFIDTLKQNNVTVYDLGGNSYGATKGQIIFVDQGDRFVRQK